MIDKTNYFQTFNLWKAKYLKNKSTYGNSVWEGVGKHPLDTLFQELGGIYVESDKQQRDEIKELFKRRPKSTWQSFFNRQPDPAWQSVLFIRRIAKMLIANDQAYLVQIGLAIADITVGLDDYRDILISLAILKYGAERVGINATSIIDKSISNYSIDLGELLQNLKSWSENSVALSIKNFGPEDWAQEL